MYNGLRKNTLYYLTALVLALLVYIPSTAPGALWQDSGMFQYRVYNGDIEGGLGLALAHPLYHLIGFAVKSIPLGEFGYRVNLISAVCGALTIANIFLLVRIWLRKTLPAAVAAISLALSWTFWQHSAIAEVYTLYTAIFSAELIVLYMFCKTNQPRYLILLGFVNGLSIANHMWGIIPLAVYGCMAIYVLAKNRNTWPVFAAFILAWTVGAFPYEYLIIEQYLETRDLPAVISSALFGSSWASDALNVAITPRIALENVLFIGLSFATPNILLIFAGCYAIRKTAGPAMFKTVIAILLGLFFIFAFRYTVPDRYAFFIPFYCLSAIFMGVGANWLLKRTSSGAIPVIVLIFAFLPPLVYFFVPAMAQKAGVSLGTKRQIPFRNDYEYFLQPWQGGNTGPQQFAESALNQVPEDSIIIADGTTVYALWYAQAVHNMAPSVKVLSNHGDYENPIAFPDVKALEKLLQSHDIYVVSPIPGYTPKFMLENYDFKTAGNLHKVREK
ncbi:putative membrane protein [Anaerohalosphaera lusitana]|uniref:Putative membrane protein n=1 Tax=Anaerohalosphaera lusitana TaxID=1936003 RepID=A0A1U9NRJ6_9BACT|nr:DUF2723 domain-containing protein [Anaerohalosphaera lusitana]AQT70344.1 putative membrane protein [Anaerohalosphaera lusitana]